MRFGPPEPLRSRLLLGLAGGPLTASVPVPVNTAVPTVNMGGNVGGPYVSDTIDVSDPGTWTNTPTSYTYQWMRGGSPISGATSINYQIVEADMGESLSCRVVAINAGGSSAPAESSTAGAASATLSNTIAPVATDDNGGTSPATVSTTEGSWDSNPPGLTYSYQWNKNGMALSGENGTTVYGDMPGDFTCEVTAYNSAYPSGVMQVSSSVSLS